ncbi:hypothetical protein VNO77_23038 [Canavalia gladiata]|uniref:Uncharacterized protein n=1 Tax=Canavalia gladiata TaxID=3824 RepID=A0AAN9L728_CANGL
MNKQKREIEGKGEREKGLSGAFLGGRILEYLGVPSIIRLGPFEWRKKQGSRWQHQGFWRATNFKSCSCSLSSKLALELEKVNELGRGILRNFASRICSRPDWHGGKEVLNNHAAADPLVESLLHIHEKMPCMQIQHHEPPFTFSAHAQAKRISLAIASDDNRRPRRGYGSYKMQLGVHLPRAQDRVELWSKAYDEIMATLQLMWQKKTDAVYMQGHPLSPNEPLEQAAIQASQAMSHPKPQKASPKPLRWLRLQRNRAAGPVRGKYLQSANPVIATNPAKVHHA